MPPHLHPRSRMTSSLFATTVLASFLVVALPHILPCPVPRTKYADGEIVVDEHGRRRRWRSKGDSPQQDNFQTQQDNQTHQYHQQEHEGGLGPQNERQNQGQKIAQPDAEGIVQFDQIAGRERTGEERRECPVPKPGGVVGEWLGFGRDGGGGRGK